MTRFVTVNSPGLPKPVLLWEEQASGAPRILGRFDRVDQVPGAEDLDVWRFDGKLSTVIHGTVNAGNHPVVDADGAPLWEGARITFRVPTFYVNSEEGTGAYVRTDEYGGTYFVADKEMNVHSGRNGTIVGRRREQYAPVSDWPDQKHELAGYRVLSSGLGDPFEHGRMQMFFRLDDDPRNVCELESSPRPRGHGI